MKPATQQRVVLVTRPTWYQQLLARHGTRQQASFFLASRDQSIDEIQAHHERFEAALKTVLDAIPVTWRRSRVDRSDLDRFLFEPNDIVLALGQDGLVANTAKYLDGQAVIGINPDRSLYCGVLVPFAPGDAQHLLTQAAAGRGKFMERTMVEAELDDGQRLLALNEIFIGHRTHQSARYEIAWQNTRELQSSSGVIVSTGTGSTGWALSIHSSRHTSFPLPHPTEQRLIFFTREAWPSPSTGNECIEGMIYVGQSLRITSRMDEGGVLFGDGIEADHLEFNYGRQVLVSVARQRLRLMIG